MKLLPHSLFGRNLVLFAGLIIAVQLSMVLAFYQYVQKPRLEQLAALMVEHQSLLKTVVFAHPPDERLRFIQQFNAAGKTQIELPGAQPATFDAPFNILAKHFDETLKKDPYLNVDFHWKALPKPEMWSHISQDGVEYWARTQGEIFDGSLSASGLFAAFLFYCLFTFACAYLIQRRINRPLREFVHAAEQIGSGHTLQPLPENRPREIAAVSRSFNAMARNLARFDSERAVMLAGVSHDLRTPLTKIQLGIALLSTCEEDEELKLGMVRHIEEINQIIEQFVDFARIGSDEKASHFDLNEMITTLAQEFAAHGFIFELKLEPLPAVSLRPMALYRCISNLMRNAVKYGAQQLAVQSLFCEGYLQISILDRGPGIPPEEVQRLKQPFTRMDQARSMHSGSGLGLAIVDRVAQLHGGELLLLQRRQGGLEARICLPVHASENSQ